MRIVCDSKVTHVPYLCCSRGAINNMRFKDIKVLPVPSFFVIQRMPVCPNLQYVGKNQKTFMIIFRKKVCSYEYHEKSILSVISNGVLRSNSPLALSSS